MHRVQQRSQSSFAYSFLPFAVLLVVCSWFFRSDLVDLSFYCQEKSSAMYQSARHYFYRLDTLAHENTQLQSLVNEQQIQLVKLSHAALRYDQLMDEILTLKKTLGVKEKATEATVVSVVHAWDKVSQRALRVKTHGQTLSHGMLALDTNGKVIGRVSESSERSAVIRLLQDQRSAMPVFVGPGKVHAVAMGNGVDIDLHHLPIDSGIVAGDVVYAAPKPGKAGSLFSVGLVHSVQDSPDQSFLIARVIPAADVRLHTWLVLL